MTATGNVRLACISCFLLVLLVFAHRAAANGVYIPSVAIERLPEIPVQRAMIVHRDGMETLVVESAVDATSPEVGWILPLPQPPIQIEKSDPGMLVSLTMALRPRIVHDLGHPWAIPLAIIALLSPAAMALVFTRRDESRRSNVVACIYGAIAVLLIGSCLLPSLARAPDATVTGITVLSSQKVGGYTVDTLVAKSATDLQRWLEANGLRPLPAQGITAIDSYIASGWCFAVAKLDVAAGRSTPHPLAITFPAKRPVFPMRLTGLAGSKTRVELFVVADGSAESRRFHASCSDQFSRSAGYMQGQSASLTIAHPDAAKLLWEKCVVTKLQADLTPAEMQDDVEIEVGAFRAHREMFYTSQARNTIVLSVIGWAALVALAILAFAARVRRKPSRGARIAIASVAVAAMVAIAVFLAVIDVRHDVRTGRERGGKIGGIMAARRVNAALSNRPETLQDSGPHLPAKAIQAILQDEEARENPLQGGDRRWERSPGNLWREGDDVVLYDLDTMPLIVAPLSRPAQQVE